MKLKNNKAAQEDVIVTELLKEAGDPMVKVLEKLFMKECETNLIPEE